ncbi:MAG: hypothetical protein KGL10_07110, partial [Alphaproteobacteria bacterium]|nr:hypothetical protein [Alphaproteobacteria bacterium]
MTDNSVSKMSEISIGGQAGAMAPEDSKKSQRIGDRLVEQGLISIDQLNVALHEKQKSGKMIGQILVELGFVQESSVAAFLSESTGYQQFDPKKTMLDPDALALMTKKDVLKY